jgi:hypothetical protein
VDGTWQITYGYDDQGEVNVTWPAEPVEVQQTVVAKSDDTQEPDDQSQELIADEKNPEEPVAEEKAGRRNRSDDQ